MKVKNLIIFLIIIGFATVAVIYIMRTPVEELAEDVDISPEARLAQCLTEKGAEFYGTHWCPACQRQKELFAEAAEYLPYIECDQEQASQEEIAKCINAGIRTVPTWQFADGKQESGILSIDRLAELSGCLL